MEGRGYIVKRIRYGILGCGTIAHTHAEAIMGIREAVVAACFDINETAARSFGEKYGCTVYTDLAALLAEDTVDAVAVCTPCATHTAIIRKAADYGKHILCEKPVEVSADRFQGMIDYCTARRVLFAGVLQHRYDPAVEAVRRVLDTGHIGELLCASVRMMWHRDEDYFHQSSWRTTRENGGTALINQGIHYVDLLLYLAGDVASVCGSCCTLGKDALTENYASAQLHFRNGAVGSIECTTVAYPGLYSELGLFGEKGSLVLRNDELFFYEVKGERDPVLEQQVNSEAVLLKNRDNLVQCEGHRRQYADFNRAILGDAPLQFDAGEALKTIRFLEALEVSSRERCWVNMEQ